MLRSRYLVPLGISILWLCLDICGSASAESTKTDGANDFCEANSIGETCQQTSLFGDDFCLQSSQTSLAVQMVQYSSPKGSRSFEKMKRILSNHQHFLVDLGGSQGVFDSVAMNIVTMLEGYGLEHVNSSETSEDVLIVHTLFSKWEDEKGTLFLDRPKTSVVVIQTEQVCCSHYGDRAKLYFAKCHQSANCVMWEYSDMNHQWLQEQHFGDSTLLFPTLHQNRLDPYLSETVPSKLAERTIDVVFFGVMTPRRKQIASQIQSMARGRWNNIVLEEVSNSGTKLDYMAKQYANSKICLIVHSFQASSPGEYHRLSELATSGCVPVIETFGDTFGIDVYDQCGGVVFSDLANIPFVIQEVLDALEKHDATLSRRIQWWEDRIKWSQLLGLVFD